MKKVTVIVEKGSDGMYSCYVEETLKYCGLAGYGKTADDAKKDLLETYQDMKELEAIAGRQFEELEFVYEQK